MCNLYRVRTNAAEIAQLFRAEIREPIERKEDIYPRYQAPVVREDEATRVLELMAWGFPTQVPGKTKTLTKHVANARNILSPFWKSAAATDPPLPGAIHPICRTAARERSGNRPAGAMVVYHEGPADRCICRTVAADRDGVRLRIPDLRTQSSGEAATRKGDAGRPTARRP